MAWRVPSQTPGFRPHQTFLAPSKKTYLTRHIPHRRHTDSLTLLRLAFAAGHHAIEAIVGAGQVGGEALVGCLVAKRFGNHPELFRGKVGYYAPRLCPKA